MIKGHCDLDILLDPFFLSSPPRQRNGYGNLGWDAKQTNSEFDHSNVSGLGARNLVYQITQDLVSYQIRSLSCYTMLPLRHVCVRLIVVYPVQFQLNLPCPTRPIFDRGGYRRLFRLIMKLNRDL